jgi:tetratricopeptide (TPR) repeat protein
MIVGRRKKFLDTFHLLLYCLLNLSAIHAFGQTDLTQYATVDLFKAKPIGTTAMASGTSDVHYMEVIFQQELDEGIEFWHNNQLDDAAHHFEVMIDQYPDVSFLHYLKGGVLYDAEKFDAAIESLNEALQIDPLFLESKYLIGRIQIDKEEYKAAKGTMELLLNVPKYEAFGYNGLGMVAQAEGNYYKASRMYEKSVKADSSFKESYIPLTYLELGIGVVIKSIAGRMDRAVEIDPLWQ